MRFGKYKAMQINIHFYIFIMCLMSCTHNPLENAHPVLTDIDIVTAKTTFFAGEVFQFETIGQFSNGQTQNITSSVIWQSSNQEIGSIDQVSGLFTAKKGGIVNITATARISPKDATISLQDTIQNVSVIETIYHPIANRATHVQFNNDGSKAYFLTKERGYIYKLDLQHTHSEAKLDSIELPGRPEYFIQDKQSTKCYIHTKEYAGIPIVDLSTFQQIGEIELDYHSPLQIRYDEQKQKLYVLISSSALSTVGTLSIVNTNTNTIEDKISWGGRPSCFMLDEERDKAFVADINTDRIYCIDLRSKSILSEIIRFEGQVPSEIIKIPGTSKAYVVNTGSFFISIIDLISDQMIKKIELQTLPQNLFIDTRYHRAYLTLASGNELSVINIDDDRIVGSIKNNAFVSLLDPPKVVFHPSQPSGYIIDKFKLIRFNSESYNIENEMITEFNPIDLAVSQDGQKQFVLFERGYSVIAPF